MKNFFIFCFFVLVSLSLFSQAPPPERINYQGVLRDSSGNPLNGNFSMVFSFYDSPTGGTLLWEETYSSSNPPEISVSNALFSAQLGDIMHRTNGSESAFVNVFTKFMYVYLGIKVGTDPEMTPRIWVISSSYAQNANTFDGRDSGEFAKLDVAETISANWINTKYPWSDDEVSDVLTIGAGSTIDPSITNNFLNTSSTTQTKTGKVIFNASSGNYGVEGYGPTAGGYFKNSTQSGYASVGIGDYGIDARGNYVGGYFKDLNDTGYAYVGWGNNGINGYGSNAGGYFADSDSSGYAYVGYGDLGIDARGSIAGGYFANTSGGNAWTYIGYLNGTQYEGIRATARDIGGHFYTTKGTGIGEALLGYYDGTHYKGILAKANDIAGYFENTSSGGTALSYIGYEKFFPPIYYEYYGIYSEGSDSAGYFKDSDNSGYAYVGYGDYGIDARGNTAGGYFSNTTGTGTARAYVGYLNGNSYQGIYAEGSSSGAYFRDSDNSGYAYVGDGNRGISAYGNSSGGFFRDTDGSGYAYVGYGNEGIEAIGDYVGGYFADLNNSGYAYVGFGDRGISAYGNYTGGYFKDADSTSYAYVGYDTYKIYGSGTVSFVQNHPYEKDKVIVYAAPEGDEVATYTRGTGKLINGEARIKLGETFKWVTNPDIGLTAHLTPRENCNGLYVESISTEELIVKELNNGKSNAQFDYIVYGLRVGFEESSIVQEKQIESFIPSFKDHRERYKKYPDLRNFNALERFKNMEAEVKGISKEEIELSRAIALKEAIHEYDPEKDPPVEKLFGYNLPEEPTNEIKDESIKEENNPNPPVLFEKEIKEENKREIIREEKIIKEEDDLSCFIVYNQVEKGDVVVMNIQNGLSLVLSNKEYDPMVVGVVSREKECRDGKIYVKTSGVAYVKVDANVKEIKRGDLIVTSFSLGYGMRGENAPQGTVLGKALENLEGGTGKIKVLLMAR